jgi:hypothetical protein
MQIEGHVVVLRCPVDPRSDHDRNALQPRGAARGERAEPRRPALVPRRRFQYTVLRAEDGPQSRARSRWHCTTGAALPRNA